MLRLYFYGWDMGKEKKYNLMCHSRLRGNPEKRCTRCTFWIPIFMGMTFLIFTFSPCATAKLTNNVHENKRQYGSEVITKYFSEEEGRSFTGKKVYQLPFFGWQVEVLYTNGMSFSEAARPKGNKVNKQLITEKEANAIADFLFPKKERGAYRKQVTNANFISHFFESGVVSYEMRLDDRRKRQLGVSGVRTVLYEKGQTFKNIMINAYH